jgi:F420-dependent oxidoreductase-like protein
MSMIKFGLQHPCFTYDGKGHEIFETVKKRAQYAEECGFDGFFVMDHFFQIPYVGALDEPMLESWTTISALTQVTKKIRLGTLVTGNIYRNPALLAKMAANIDVMSNGRLFMGIGAGWFETEANAFDMPFYTALERSKRLEEAVQIVRGMWINPKGFSFQGKYYNIKNALCLPEPIQKPHPQIMIGGSGEKLTLKLVAEYADSCNLFGGPKTNKAKLEALKKHCSAVGRDYEEILKTSLTSLVIGATPQEVSTLIAKRRRPGMTDQQLEDTVLYGTPEQVAAKIQERIQVGIQYLIFNFDHPNEENALKLFAEKVMPQFK